jgi:hypothetical protein
VARTHPVSVAVYWRHIQLYRYLNDAWIFTSLIRPELADRANALRASKSKAKKPYRVPKRDITVKSKRTDADVGQIFRAQFERGIFETQIISIVSRVEAFIQDCMFIAILDQPRKLTIIAERGGIPIELFLDHSSRDDLLESFIALRCQDLMFGKPSEYITKAAKVLSIEIKQSVIDNYIEMKASRDVIIHNRGEINQIYLDKARAKARGALGEELAIDEDYFADVVVNAKMLSGAIQKGTERTYN